MHSVIWPKRVSAAEQGMVFRLFESLTDRIHNFTIKRREQGVFLYWKPLKEENVGDEQPTFVVPTTFFPKNLNP